VAPLGRVHRPDSRFIEHDQSNASGYVAVNQDPAVSALSVGLEFSRVGVEAVKQKYNGALSGGGASRRD
jgi:hypothetical protein